MRTLIKSFIFIGLMQVLIACDKQSSETGFSLPEGDAENGQLVFIELGCIQCHILAGTEFLGDQPRFDDENEVLIEIGGDSTKLQTYADLVTSVINPNHRLANGYNPEDVTLDGQSRMTNFNEIMRVSELIDLVTFLKSQYELQSVPLTIYPGYIYE